MLMVDCLSRGILKLMGSTVTSFLEYVWSQEEARNAGAWSFVRPRFASALGLQVSSGLCVTRRIFV